MRQMLACSLLFLRNQAFQKMVDKAANGYTAAMTEVKIGRYSVLYNLLLFYFRLLLAYILCHMSYVYICWLSVTCVRRPVTNGQRDSSTG
jgi:hypothetical protein